MKTAELEGAALDYYVEKALGYPIYKPSEDWECGGPIIECERIWISDETEENAPVWIASAPPHVDVGNGRDLIQYGPTPLIAAMRAFVASKFGDEVPDIKEMA